MGFHAATRAFSGEDFVFEQAGARYSCSAVIVMKLFRRGCKRWIRSR